MGGDGAEEEGLHEGLGQLGGSRHRAGEERREGDDSWTLHGEDAPEARDQGGEARGLRQAGLRQGQAGQDGGEGLLRGSPQEEHLSLSPASVAWADGAALSGRPADAACEPGLERSLFGFGVRWWSCGWVKG